tara:strand:+ start:187660 stop:188022 length:363 start_codon:yes stop_codon:yes gene_type:complete
MDNTEKRHYAVYDPYDRVLTLKRGDEVLAKTTKAIMVKEVGKGVYDPVFYIPKEDVKIKLNPEDRTSTCPIKGVASYWMPEIPTDNYFAWSYEDANPRAKKIKGHIAFNMADVTLISEPI